jgi:hypothetical protein
MTTRKIGIHLPAELVNTVARRMGLSNKGAEDEICMMLLANSTNIGWNEEFQLFGTIEDSTYESEGLDQPLVKLQ